MGRFGSFLAGIFVGAIGLNTAMHYHVVHAETGVHLVRKTNVGLNMPYADIRKFGINDWRQNPALARALLNNRTADPMAARIADVQKSVSGAFGNVLASSER